MAEKRGLGGRDDVERMLADAVLAPDIRREDRRPTSEDAGTPRLALVTGACGFLGRQVARELLRRTDLHLVCLVRDKGEESAAARVARIFTAMGIGREELESRVEVRVGDVAAPDLGLSAEDHADLAGRVDAIYHCAALVDWVRGYGQLYRMNVGGVLAMIRLACQGRTKRLVFVSSIAVCYARGGPERIDEDTDMLPHIGGMPLGYARSKCVAEALLRQAASRGVPVTVLRPALIAGDSATGESNPADLIAALIQGCIATGMAIDTDWLLDCVPVDFVARVMARVPQGEANFQVLNLTHERPRHWRELILWINLHGYPVDLVESDAWIRHLFDQRHGRGTMLYAQRRFFRGRPVRAGEVRRSRPYEAYLAAGQRRIDASRTRALLRRIDVREAPLDTDLLHAYFEYYRRAGVLPSRVPGDGETLSLDGLLGSAWRPRGLNGAAHRWVEAERTRIGSDDGLLSEIGAARVSGSGLWRLRFRDEGKDGGPDYAVLKVKAGDRLIQDLTVQLAGVCRPELGILFGRYRDALGLAGCHERELALYELDEPRLRRHMPACHGTRRNPHAGRWALLLEYLPEAEVGRSRLRAGDAGMGAVLGGLAEIHAVWYRREQQLAAQAWLAARPDPARMGEMAPLWRELADFAAPWFESWCGGEIHALQAELIAGLDAWWPCLVGMPATLIHNDFNPRNLVLRQADGRLCVYDWELSTLGPPQHDLAELLCFTWQDNMTERDLGVMVDKYRAALSSASNRDIDPPEWREGFSLALRHLLIDRFAMYTLMHRFRPLDYLPGVMVNWMRLHTWSRDWSLTPKGRCPSPAG
jgi:thioester reductase-like protein